MAIFNLFSKRKKKINGKAPDVYVYDEIPDSLRVQIVHIIIDTIGDDKEYRNDSRTLYNTIHRILCKEYGVFTLIENAKNDKEAIIQYFLDCKDYERCLDIIEICFRVINYNIKKKYFNYQQRTTSSQNPVDAVAELNSRFQESGVGYQFEEKEIIQVDSQYLHSEAVKPLLHLLSSNKMYTGANNEFLCAHEHYRHKRYKECLNDCLKSFESLMKAILDKHKWPYDGKKDTAKNLINICLLNNLVPDYLQNQFSSFRSLLESGIPTIRNKEGGHGQGTAVTDVPEYLASYGLHLTATNLLFLAKCDTNYK